MKNRNVIISFLVVLTILFLNGCSFSRVPKLLKYEVEKSYKQKGLVIAPATFKKEGDYILYALYENQDEIPSLYEKFNQFGRLLTTEELGTILVSYSKHSRYIGGIILYSEEYFDKELNGKNLAEVTKTKSAEVLARKNGYVYISAINKINTDDMEQKEIDEINECVSYIPSFFKSVEILKKKI